VMRRVFEGGVGWRSGGIVLRSIDIGLRDSLDAGRDAGGELPEDILWGCVVLLCRQADISRMYLEM
jgi:hypothetical protein